MCCACATSSFHFWSVVSYDSCVLWGRERCHFFGFDNSFMWYEQFCPEGNFYFDDFYFIPYFDVFYILPYAKVQKPRVATPILPITIGTISKCILYRSRYRHTKFRTCMKNRTIFAICHSTAVVGYIIKHLFYETA